MSYLLRTFAALCLMSGCSGSDPEDDDGLTPLDTEPLPRDTVDTGLDGSYVDAAFFAVIGSFAYDEDNERFASYAHPDAGLLPMSLTVLLIDSSLMETGVLNEDNSCSVSLEFDGPRDNAPWVESHGGWAGVDVPSDARVRDTCQFYGLPSAFEGDAARHVVKWSWGMGVGPLSDTTRQMLIDSLPASEWAALEPYAVGASLYSNLLTGSGLTEDGYFGDGFGIGYQVDGNFQVVLGGTGNPQPIGKEFINAPGGIATGYYETEFLFQPGTTLTNTPY